MKTFKDNMGQMWNLQLTLARTRVLREKLGLDLLNPQHYLQVCSSLTDRMAFVFLLCEEEARSMDISAEGFEERLYGDGFADQASIAFLAETEFFFQRLGQDAMAKLARRSIETMKAGQARLSEMLTSGQFDSLLDDAESEIQKLLQGSAGSGSPSSQPSSA